MTKKCIKNNLSSTPIGIRFLVSTVLFLIVLSMALVGCQSSKAETKTPSATLVPNVPAPSRTSVMPTPIGDPTGIEVFNVESTPDGAFIMVTFTAPPETAEKWWQGSVYVIAEATGDIYKDIPVAPRIGPLFGKPKKEGQSGYVMLYNTKPGIKSGALVTVILGGYKKEHMVVQ